MPFFVDTATNKISYKLSNTDLLEQNEAFDIHLLEIVLHYRTF